jgi:hypothetical protein
MPISTGEARRIASQWHGGQRTALYEFSSSGTIASHSRLLSEIETDLRGTIDDADAAVELRSLQQWVSARDAERQQLLADILIGAVEGGTGYWATVSDYQHSGPAADTSATLHEIESGDDEHPDGREVTTETIEAGIQAILDPYFRVLTHLRAAITHAHNECDAGGLDAEAADVIVQAGLFGEIVYG